MTKWIVDSGKSHHAILEEVADGEFRVVGHIYREDDAKALEQLLYKLHNPPVHKLPLRVKGWHEESYDPTAVYELREGQDGSGEVVLPGAILSKGDTNEPLIYLGLEQLPSPGKSGKIRTTHGVFFPYVYNCKIVVAK